MMPLKASLSFLGAMLVAVALIAGALLYRTISTEHDGWDIFAPVDTTTEPITVQPADLLTKDDRESIEHVVRETRTYGIPWSIWVVSRDELGNDLPADEVAQNRYEETPVESRAGAEDGLLMTVVVTDDHTQTEVAFATGPNFYPKGGITPERLDYIVDVQMGPLIQESRIGDAVIEGATWVEWTQLFEPTPYAPPTKLEEGLRELLSPIGALAFGGLAALVLLAAGGVALITWRGTAGHSDIPVTTLQTAATSRGRVDHAVVSGMVLDALDRGVIRFEDGHYQAAAAANAATGLDTSLLAQIEEMERAGIAATPRNLTRSVARRTTVRQDIEDTLAQAGMFHPKSPAMTLLLRGVSAVGLALGAVGLVLSVLGESRPALATALALAVISLVALIWNERRSWATRHGMQIAKSWRDRHQAPSDRERLLYQTVVDYETIDLLATHASPVRDDAHAALPSPTR